MPSTVFSPTAFESTADGLDGGNQVVERNLSVRGTLAVSRGLQVAGTLTPTGGISSPVDVNATGFANPGANGELGRVSGSLTELLTIAASPTSTTVAQLLPANSVIRAVVARVVVAIPTAATFSIGDGTTAARFAAGVAVAINTTAVGLTHVDQTGAAGPKQTAAAQIVITPNLTPGTNVGRVRLTVYFDTYTAPTA